MWGGRRWASLGRPCRSSTAQMSLGFVFSAGGGGATLTHSGRHCRTGRPVIGYS